MEDRLFPRPIMPSHLHEALLLLFRNRPALATGLLSNALHVQLPSYNDIRLDSAELTDIQPAEYRADMVILLLEEIPVLGIVLEVQLSKDEDKRYVWPVYVTNLRARIRCPVCLLVVTTDEAVARWAGKAVDLGGGNRFIPWVVGPSGVPEVTDEQQAREDPELAVLSAMAHAKDLNADKAARIALLAQMVSLGLDADRSTLYCDLILLSLSEGARAVLQAMDIVSKYKYQSVFAPYFYADGRTQGRIEITLKLLTKRYGALSSAVELRVRNAGETALDCIAERLLTAPTLEEALAPLTGD